MLPRFSSAAHHLSPPAVTVQLDPAVCFADQAILGNENYEIPFHDTFFLEFVPYLMLNICLLALSFRSQKSDADSVAAARPSFRDDVFEAILSKKTIIKIYHGRKFFEVRRIDGLIMNNFA